ncbi:MAG: hypothetical protein ABIP48_26210 [Planctomycetota bacterium]
MADTSSLDYVGFETFRFLGELLSVDEGLLESISTAMDRYPKGKRKHWNDIVQNCFEAVGMMGVDDLGEFVDRALRLLTTDSATLTNQTKYNIVRCLERLHDSAWRPYGRHVMEMDWQATPDEQCFGVAAVRGFHRRLPELGYTAQMEFLSRHNESTPEQLPVSDLLVALLEHYAGGREPNGGLLEVNCSLALIRWLHKDYVARLFELGDRVCPETRGNLFHACRRLRRCGELLSDHCEFFSGMYLYFVGREVGRLPIRIEKVTFFESKFWKKKFESPVFPAAQTKKLEHYTPSYSYVSET